MAPELDDAAPELEDVAPELEERPPELEDEAPELEDVAPELVELPPELDEVDPPADPSDWVSPMGTKDTPLQPLVSTSDAVPTTHANTHKEDTVRAIGTPPD